MTRTHDFNELDYILANEDVLQAISNGIIPSAFFHYQKYGHVEGRPLQVPDDKVTRRQRILKGLNLLGRGVEIGPSFNPVAPKKLGYRVLTVDHLDADSLRQKYRNDGVCIDNIENVDYVWSGQNLESLLPGKNDYVIASHVVEHVPNFVKFIKSCENLISDDGVIVLAVPDKRNCFDYFGSVTMIGDVIDAWLTNNTRPTPGQVLNCYSNTARYNNSLSWAQDDIVPELFYQGALKPDAMPVELYIKSLNNNDYIDSHVWRFTPSSFELLIYDLHSMGLINLYIDSIEKCDVEFIVKLKIGPNTNKSALRQSFFINIRNELSRGV